MGKRTTPTLTSVAVVLCDDLYRDELTGKMVLVGTFNSVNAPTIPYTLNRMAILVTLTGGHGDYNVSISIEHESTGNEVFRVGGPLSLPNPLDYVDLDLRLKDISFVEEGRHWINVWDAEELINRRGFVVRKIELGSSV